MTPKETLDELERLHKLMDATEDLQSWANWSSATEEAFPALLSDSRKLAAANDLVNQLKADAESEMELGGVTFARNAEEGLHRGMSVGFTLAAGRLLKIIEGAQS